jgi:hypothetical protein
MTQNFVRYSPDVERPDPNFEQNLQTVLDGMKRHMKASVESEGIGRMVRDAHAKGFGLAQGEVEKTARHSMFTTNVGTQSLPERGNPQFLTVGTTSRGGSLIIKTER